jgi:hypothetical protein
VEQKKQQYMLLDKDYADRILKGEGDTGADPASVKETEWFMKQSKEVQDKHIELKRRINPTFAEKLELKQAESKIKVSEAGEIEEAKLKKKLRFEPELRKALKIAEKEAAERGEVLTDLSRMESALPGLKDAVAELRDLSSIATSTLGGKAFDFAVKESGFGSTKGADARAKFIAIVNNQVLPLLKQTFGGSFTEEEGRGLKNTFGDPDASPDEKMAQLDAFISQKERDIKTKQSQLGNANQGDVKDLSDEDLFK